MTRHVRCRRSTAIIVGAVLAVLGTMDTTVAQQQLPPAPGPDGGPPFSEIVIQAGGQGFAGLATFYVGTPTIFYDATWLSWMGGFQSPGFRFLRAHEYGHHRLGHTLAQYTTPPAMLPMLGYQSELEADCWAVRVLRGAGDMAAIQAGFEIYQRTLPPQDTNGRPGGLRRTQNMQSC